MSVAGCCNMSVAGCCNMSVAGCCYMSVAANPEVFLVQCFQALVYFRTLAFRSQSSDHSIKLRFLCV